MSHQTAISRNKPSAPTRWLLKKGLISGKGLDYGCGKGVDADALGFDKYDPYWFPGTVKGEYDTIICNYVINVVDKDAESKIVSNIKSLLKSGSSAFITVRRDLPIGGAKGRGCWQRNVLLDLPIVRETSTYCIYKLEKE